MIVREEGERKTSVGFMDPEAVLDLVGEAGVLTLIFEFHLENRDEHVVTKDQLLAIGERTEAQVSVDRMDGRSTGSSCQQAR